MALRTVGTGSARRAVSYKELEQIGVDPRKPIDNPDEVLRKLGKGGGKTDSPLAILAGSEKQVKWANDIRSQFLKDLSAIEGKLAQPGKTAVTFLKAIPDSRYWIDNRKATATQHLESLQNGLFINAKGGYYVMKNDGKIYKKWSQIIPDGKGGYKKEFEAVVDPKTWKKW